MFILYTDITIPPVIKKRGRPKGHGLTVIGVPKKKQCTNKIQPFIKLHSSIKDKGKLFLCIII